MQDQDWETGRLEAFSDGVLAIAVTLLVLEIRTPDGVAPGGLGGALVHLHYARLRGPLLEGLDLAVVRAVNRGFAIGIVLYAFARLLAPVSATSAMLVWAGLAIFFLRGSPRPGVLA